MSNSQRLLRVGLASLVAYAIVSLINVGVRTAAAEKAHVVPAPTENEAVGASTSEVAVLAGGCFWGVQGVYQHVKGVTSAISGYAGGQQNTAHYQMVGS